MSRRHSDRPTSARPTSSLDEAGPASISPSRSRRSRASRIVLGGGALLLATTMLAACGSSSSGNNAPKGEANTTAAQEAIAPFVGKPSAFPVDKPLTKKLPAGSKFVFLQCGTTVCTLVANMLKPAVEAAGAEFVAVNSGNSAASAQAAVSSVAAMKPAAVLIAGNDPALYGGGLKTLSDGGAKVVSISISKDTAPFGITANYIGEQTARTGGQLLADWVITKKGGGNEVVFYGVPALDYARPLEEGFKAEMAKNCSSCTVRVVPMDIATLGTTAPQTIVTDLQSHPKTTTAVFASYEMARGLPAALNAAGKKDLTTTGYSPTPVNLQDIKDGKLTSGLGVDLPISAWTAVDVAARLVNGEELSQGEKEGSVPRQFLEQKDITFDPTKGWTGYPDFTDRFKKLWSAAS